MNQITTARKPWSWVRPRNWIAEVRAEVDASFRDRLSVSRLSSAVGIHRDYLSSRFGEEFGVGIRKYIRLRRVAWAARALAESEAPPREIAREAGFYDQSHLRRGFSALVGLGPGPFQRGVQSQSQRLARPAARSSNSLFREPDDLVIAWGCAVAASQAEVRGQEPARSPEALVTARSITIVVRARNAPPAAPRLASSHGPRQVIARVESLDSKDPFTAELDLERGLLEFLNYGRLDPWWRWYLDAEPAEPAGNRAASFVDKARDREWATD